MQFLVYDPNIREQPSAPPSPEMMEEMGRFIAEAAQAGIIVTTGGLHPKGTRIQLAAGVFTVTDGPFIEVKELLGGFAVIRTSTLDEAIAWTKRFRAIIGDGESEIAQIYGGE